MTEWLYQTFAEPWTHVYFVKAAIGGSIIAVACAVLGCYIILRRMAFIGDAMSHALLPGVGIGYLVMNAFFPGGFTAGGLLLGALIAAVLTSLCISFLSQVGRLSDDTAIGIIYTGLFAAGVVILTRFQQYINIDLNHFFQGDIYGVSWSDMWLGAIGASVVLGLLILFYRHFTLVSFDPIMAASIGYPTRFIHILLTGMIALICVAGISMVGVIMIVGLLITPAALAYMLTDRLPRMMALAAFFGILSVVAGLYFSEWVNASGGGAIMFTGFLLFLIGLFFAPKHGLLAAWIRRYRLVPQSDLEDILKAAYEGITDIRGVNILPKQRRRGLKRLAADGLLDPEDARADRLKLTVKGLNEAAHILRSHQLWEAHFIQEGMPYEQAHVAAEKLEHLHQRDILDRFDDELNHPARDAEGVLIPGEVKKFEDLSPELRLSLLRCGDHLVVIRTPVKISADREKEKFQIVSVKESEGDLVWTLESADGFMINFSHEQADLTFVRRM
jgi:manganese/iron transport system permease protein/iron/zinc/copper transport system permease protein